VVTSNRCYLDRALNIRVNIVKNPFGAMNHSEEFHYGLLSDDAMLTKFKFASLDTLKQTLLC